MRRRRRDEEPQFEIRPSSNVLLFDVRQPSVVFAEKQLTESFVSICPAFFNTQDGQLLLVNEK